MINQELSSEFDAIVECVEQFYKNLYTEVDRHRPLLYGLDFSTLSLDDVVGLEKPFNREEVVGMVQGFAGDKAPGPDKFLMAFFQSCWPFVRSAIMEVFQYFHRMGSFEKGLNATFLVLIPKKLRQLM